MPELAPPGRGPGAQEYFTARLGLQVGSQPFRVVEEWSARFTSLREAARYDECRTLLHGAKGWSSLPAYGRAVVLYAEGWLFDRLGETDQALRAYRRAHRAFDEAGMDRMRTTMLTQIGSLLQDRGDHDAAHDAYAEALRHADTPAERAAALVNSGGLALVRNDGPTAEGHFREALTLVDGADPRNAAVARHGLGNSLELQNRLPDAQREFAAAFRAFQELGDAFGVASAAASLGNLEAVHGTATTAIELLTLSLTIFQAIQDTGRVAATLNNLGIAHTAAGDRVAAVGCWEQALLVHTELGNHSAAEAVERRMSEAAQDGDAEQRVGPNAGIARASRAEE